MTRRIPPWLIVLGVAGALFTVMPVAALLVRAPWGRLIEVGSGVGALTALRLSIVVSVSATVVALVLGVPLGWILARAEVPGRAILRAIAVLPIVLPPVVGGIGLLAALGREGLVGGWLYDVAGIQLTFTTAGAIVAATFVSMPFVVIAAETGLRSVDPRVEAAAATLGARPGTVARRVTLPLLAPHLAAGAVLAWARALGEFGATITFAGSLQGRTQTLPLAAYQARQTDPEGAIALSLVLVALSVVVLVALRDRYLGRT